MLQRQPQRATLAAVCAAHALLAWALVQAGPQAAPPARSLGAVVSVWLPALPTPPTLSSARAPQLRPDTRSDVAPVMPPERPAIINAQSMQAPDKPDSDLAQVIRPSTATSAETVSEQTRSQAAQLRPTEDASPPSPAPSPAPITSARADHQRCSPSPHPAPLRERGIEGEVRLRVRVTEQGRAADVQVVAGSGWRLFDDAAVRQAIHCHFLPAQRAGQPIESWVEFPVRFTLNG